MNQMQENTASYRHDLKNHMMVLAGLAEESKITEIQDYIEKNIASLPLFVNASCSFFTLLQNLAGIFCQFYTK